MHVKNEGFVSIRQRLDMHDMSIRCSLLLHHHQNILQRDTSFFVQWRIFTKSKNSLFMGLTKVDLPDNLIIERQIIVTWVQNENDSSGRYENKTFKSKRSNNNFAKSSKSLYYQRSKTTALKNLQQKLVITNNDMANFNISFIYNRFYIKKTFTK